MLLPFVIFIELVGSGGFKFVPGLKSNWITGRIIIQPSHVLVH